MMIIFLIFIVAIALFLQRISSERGLDAVTADHWPDQQVVEPDEPFSIRITVQNSSRRFIPFLRIRERFDAALCPQEGVGRTSTDHLGIRYTEFTTWLRPRQQLTLSLPVSSAVRGRYVLKDLMLFGGDFLGLNEQEKSCGRFKEIVVIPREAPSPRLRELLGSFMGELSVNRFIMEDPVLTLGYREYTGREPMKMISWAQSARGTGLMVKKSDYTVEPSVSVVLNTDTAAENREALLETCFSMTRSVCALLEQRGIKYSFSTNAVLAGKLSLSTVESEGLGHRHFYSVLEQLGRATYFSRTSAEQLLEKETLRQTAAGRILITPDTDALSARTLARLREAAGGYLLVLQASEVTEW